MRFLLILCLAAAAVATPSNGPVPPAGAPGRLLTQAAPEDVGLDPSRLASIAEAVGASIRAGETPGAVVLVARHGRIAYLQAFGNRSVRPEREPMTADTIFDLASLTKVVATAPSVMLLVENGTLRLDDKVKRYLPAFSGGGKDDVTLLHLLTHTSGLPADFDLSKPWSGADAAREELWKVKTGARPGKDFVYSDVNFIALGEVVRAVTGRTLDAFAREKIFEPLGMTDTGFRPAAATAPRIAPTEPRRNTLRYLNGVSSAAELDRMLRGEVHDPTAWRMGGVAGHAGVFSTSRDLAVFAQMFLDRGAYRDGRLLSSLSVDAMTRARMPAGATDLRGYGWDLGSVYSAPRGDIFDGGYGHTGFTGTSLWVHPPTDMFVILLTNRVHPDGGKDINHLRGAVAAVAASAVSDF